MSKDSIESLIFTVKRTALKIDNNEKRIEQNPQGDSEALKAINSATVSQVSAEDAIKKDSQHGRSEAGNKEKTAKKIKRAERAMEVCLEIVNEDKEKWLRPRMLGAIRLEAAERTGFPEDSIAKYTPTLQAELNKLK